MSNKPNLYQRISRLRSGRHKRMHKRDLFAMQRRVWDMARAADEELAELDKAERGRS